MLEELQKSIPVKTSNLSRVKNAALLAMTLITANVQADTFYKDYGTEDLSNYVNNKVKLLSKFEEVKIREQLGCSTGDLRANLVNILRHVNVQGDKLDITDKDYAKQVNDIVTSEKYKETGVCGEIPKKNEVEQSSNIVDVREAKEIVMPNQVRNFDLNKDVRDSKIIKPEVRKGLRL